jgi:3-methyladenine DNA glycosylase AlkD
MTTFIYVAFVSHDDEQTLVPLGSHADPKPCREMCEQHAAENHDRIRKGWEWELSDHTRIQGEWWDVQVTNQYKAKYRYYVRPVEITI